MKTKATKLTRMLAGVLLAAVTIVSVIGGSITDVNAKTSRCKTGIYVAGKFYSYKTTKTINLTMCKGCTSTYEVEDDIDGSKFDSGDQPFRIEVIKDGSVIVGDSFNGRGVEYFREKHKVTVTSSNPSVVSVKSTLTGNEKSDVYLKAKNCGTATITVKASCGNKYKIKVAVKEHSYKNVEVGYKVYKCCTRCGESTVIKDPYLVDPNWNPTEEEIYQKMMNAVGEDREIRGSEIPEYEDSWVCEDWQTWIMEKTWGIRYDRRKGLKYAKEIKDFSKARCGDIVHMDSNTSMAHVAMVVKNHHDGRLELTSWSGKSFYTGYSDEEYASHCEGLEETGADMYANDIVSYDCIDSIYTLYKD